MSPSYTADKLRLGQKIRDARKAAGKSQERIAAEVGTTRRHWIRWEQGEHRPSPGFLSRIAEATGVDESSFEDEEGDSFQPVADELARVLLDALRTVVARESVAA